MPCVISLAQANEKMCEIFLNKFDGKSVIRHRSMVTRESGGIFNLDLEHI